MTTPDHTLTDAERAEYAPTTWPEAVMPTAQEWADWFLACQPGARTRIAESVLGSHDRASRCFLENHAAALDRLDDIADTLAAVEAVRDHYAILAGLPVSAADVVDRLDVALGGGE